MVMIKEENNFLDGRLLLEDISSGNLASQIAQQASMRKDMLTPDEYVSSDDEDEDEEEIEMQAARRRSKLISDAAVMNGCIPAGLVQKPKKAPLAVISILNEAIDALQDVVSQPIAQEKFTINRSPAKAAALDANECEQAPEATAPEADVSPTVSPTSRPVKPTSPAAGRPVRRPKTAGKSPKADKSLEGVRSLKPVGARPNTPHPSRKSPLLANDGQPSPSKSPMKLRNSVKLAATFHMDTSCDEMDADTTSAMVRDSSLTRTYDALGVPFCSLDDGSDVEASNFQQSISSSYEALGKRCPSRRASRPASPAGHLPPISPPRRAACAAAGSPCTNKRPSQSAMELDLGLGSSEFAPMQHKWSTSEHSMTFKTSKSTQSLQSLTLPALPGVKVAGGSVVTKSVPTMMKSGSAGALSWSVSPMNNFLERDTRQLLY